MGWTLLNLGRGVLASAATGVGTTLEVRFYSEADLTKLSGLSTADPMPIVIDPEEIFGRDPEVVYAVADNTGVGLTRSFTVIRGRERTTAPSNGWAAGTEVMVTATTEVLEDALAEAEPVDTAVDPDEITAGGTLAAGAVLRGTSATAASWDDLFTLIRGFVVGGDNVTVVPNTTNNTLTIAATVGDGGGGLDAEQVRDLIGSTLREGSGVTITVDDAGNTVTVAASGGSGLTFEEVRDTVAAFLRAGANITLDNDDANDTLTISSTGGGGGGGTYSETLIGTWQRGTTVGATRLRFNSQFTLVDIADTDTSNADRATELQGVSTGDVLFFQGTGTDPHPVGFKVTSDASDQAGFTRFVGEIGSGSADLLPADGQNVEVRHTAEPLIDGHRIQNDSIGPLALEGTSLSLQTRITTGSTVGDYQPDSAGKQLFIGTEEPNTTDNTLVVGDLWIKT